MEDSTKEYQKKEYFEAYLQETFQINLIESQHYFLIVPVQSCGPCVEESLYFGRKNLNRDNFTIILWSSDSETEKSLKRRDEDAFIGNVLTDSKAYLDWVLSVFSPALLIYKDSSVKIEELKAGRVENVFSKYELTILKD